MEETALINSNRIAIQPLPPLEKGKTCIFFTCSTVTVLLCVIVILVMNLIIVGMLSGSNANQLTINSEYPSMIVEHVANQAIKKGQPVGICAHDLTKVCPIEVQGVSDSILQNLKRTPIGTEFVISHVSDVSYKMSILVQHAKHGKNQQIIFNGILSNFPIVYYSVKSIDILQAIGEKPLADNESFKLMGAKVIYFTDDYHKSTSRSIVTFIRSKPTDGMILHHFKTVLVNIDHDKDHLESTINVGNTIMEFNIMTNLLADEEFNVKHFSIGMTENIDTPVITLYFNSVSKGCQASVFSYSNSALNELNRLQNGPTNVGCNNLKSFTYDTNTILILSDYSLAAISVNSQDGLLTTKSVKSNYSPYTNLQFQRNMEISFVGNDIVKQGETRSSKFFVLYSNPSDGFSQIRPISFDGNTFTTAMLIPLSSSMKNIQVTYLDSSNINLIFQQGDNYKMMRVSFTNEKLQRDGNTYLIETPVEGMEITLGSISPTNWLVRLPSNIFSDNFIISLLVDPGSLDFQLAKISSMTTMNFNGLALQDANTDEKLLVISEGLTPKGIFNDDRFIPGMEYYASEQGVSLNPSSGVKAGKAISNNQLIIYNLNK